MRAKFQVYGDWFGAPSKSFLVQNQQAAAYNPGVNTDSLYTNPTGTAKMQVINGTVRPVLAANFPGNNR